MDFENLIWLQDWYKTHCDGVWEHTYGVHITTIDNPGWSMRVDLSGTDLQNATMAPVIKDRDERDWMRAEVVDRRFVGHGDPTKLTALLEVFRTWVTNHGTKGEIAHVNS